MEQTQLKFNFYFAHQCSALLRYYSVLKQTIFFMKFSNHSQNNLSSGIILEGNKLLYTYTPTSMFMHTYQNRFSDNMGNKKMFES